MSFQRISKINDENTVSSRQAKLILRKHRSPDDTVVFIPFYTFIVYIIYLNKKCSQELDIERYVGLDGSLSLVSSLPPTEIITSTEVCERLPSPKKRQCEIIATPLNDVNELPASRKHRKPKVSYISDVSDVEKIEINSLPGRRRKKLQHEEINPIVPQTSITEPLCISDDSDDNDEKCIKSSGMSSQVMSKDVELVQGKRRRKCEKTREPMTIVSTPFGLGIVINSVRSRKV